VADAAGEQNTAASPAQKQTPESQQDAKTPTRAPEPTASIQLTKGTVATYVDQLRKAFKQINIVVAPDADNIPLLPIMLPKVPAGAAVQVLELVAQTPVSVQVLRLDPEVDASDVYVIRPRATAVVTPPTPATPIFRVYSVAQILGVAEEPNGPRTKALTSAIQQAMDLQFPPAPGQKAAPSQQPYRLNEGLLMFTGSDAQADVIAKILAEYPKAARVQATADANTTARIGRVEKLISDLQAEVANLKKSAK
jgi:hypothetical protein